MLNPTIPYLALLYLHLITAVSAAPTRTRPNPGLNNGAAAAAKPLAVLLSAAEDGQPGAVDQLQERISSLKKDRMTPSGILAVERTMASVGERQMRDATRVGGSVSDGVVDPSEGYAQAQNDRQRTLQVVMVGESYDREAFSTTAVAAVKRARTNIRFPKQLNFTGSGAPGPVTLHEKEHPVHVFNPKIEISPSMPLIGTTKFFASIRRANDAIGKSLTSFKVQTGDEVEDGPTLFTPDPVIWTRLAQDEGRQPGYWSVPMDSIRVNGHYVDGAEGEAGIFDPATYRLAVSPLVARRLYEWVEGSAPIQSASASSSITSYSYPCSAHISVSLEFAGREHTISTTKFRITPLATERNGEAICLGAVYGLKLLNDGPRAGHDEDLS